jgi:protease-4
MVNVAASGGYYTSAIEGVPVWACPTTLTGSIGVLGGKFEVSELLARLGVGRTSIGSGPHADFYSSSRPWRAEELEKLDRDLETLYRDFVTKMAGARRLSYDALHAVAQGRVWTGKQARDVALVDRLGGLYEVALSVRERLGLAPDAELRFRLPSQPRGLAARRALAAEDANLGPLWHRLPELHGVIERALDLEGERLFALAPVEVRIRG